MTSNLAQNLKDLNSELSRGRDDESAETIIFGELLPVQLLEYRDKESQGLSASSFRRRKNIPTF